MRTRFFATDEENNLYLLDKNDNILVQLDRAELNKFETKEDRAWKIRITFDYYCDSEDYKALRKFANAVA